MLKRLENGYIDWEFLIKALELKESKKIKEKIFGNKEELLGFGYFLRYLRTLKRFYKKKEMYFFEENIKKRIENVEKYIFGKISYDEYRKNDRILIEKARENLNKNK